MGGGALTCSHCSRPVDLFNDPDNKFPDGITGRDHNGNPTGQRWLGWYRYLNKIFCGFCWNDTGIGRQCALEQYR